MRGGGQRLGGGRKVALESLGLAGPPMRWAPAALREASEKDLGGNGLRNLLGGVLAHHNPSSASPLEPTHPWHRQAWGRLCIPTTAVQEPLWSPPPHIALPALLHKLGLKGLRRGWRWGFSPWAEQRSVAPVTIRSTASSLLSPRLPSGMLVLKAFQGRVMAVTWGSLRLLQPPGLRGSLGPDPTRQTQDGCHDSWISFLSADGGTSHLG